MSDVGKNIKQQRIAGAVHGRMALGTAIAAAALAASSGKIPGVESTPDPDTPEPKEKARHESRRLREMPTTMPRDQKGQHINPSRRNRKKIKAAFLEEHGRRMNPKAWRKHLRAKKAQVPAMLDLEAMVGNRA